jgi:hypothetical protein
MDKIGVAQSSQRTILANFLEGQKPFRKYDDDGAPKLVKARIAGPVLGLRESNPKQPLDCVQVDLIMTNHPLATTVKPLRAGMPGDFRCHRCEYSCACCYHEHTRLRVHWAPGIPHALSLGESISQSSGASRCEDAD